MADEKLWLGRLDLCLPVKDIRKSAEFYKNLDFKPVHGNIDEGWLILTHHNCRLALFQGIIPHMMLNFRGANIEELAAQLESRGVRLTKKPGKEQDGSMVASFVDPDGHEIYLNTFPNEGVDRPEDLHAIAEM